MVDLWQMGFYLGGGHSSELILKRGYLHAVDSEEGAASIQGGADNHSFSWQGIPSLSIITTQTFSWSLASANTFVKTQKLSSLKVGSE